MTDEMLARALAPIYGERSVRQGGQLARYSEALAAFSAQFGQGDARLFRAPGRVNLIGEHTDYNHGYVMPMALDKDIVFVARPRVDAVVNLHNVEPERFPSRNFAISAEIPRSPLGDWANYVKGAAQALRQATGRELCGADILASGRAPWGVPAAAGLSSSSALTVVAALTLAALNGIDLPKLALARLCSEAEWYVGTRGGIMDQFISILAERDRALLLDCRPRPGDAPGVSPGGTRYDMRQVPLPLGYRALVFNSAVRREKTKSLYNVRVAECRIGVALLRRRYADITHLRDVSAEALGLSDAQVLALLDDVLPEQTTRDELRAAGMLDEPLDAMFVDFRLSDDQVYRVRRRCRHVITENARVVASEQVLSAGDVLRFGCLMNESHFSMSRDYEASCQEVDILADLCRRSDGVLGARVTGAGWGGCVVALVQDGCEAGVLEQVTRQYVDATGLPGEGFVCASAPGACECRVRNAEG
jgi:galactokinase